MLTLSKSRLEALSDGVFAIAMTLLVLELKVPDVMHQHSNHDMVEQLLQLRPAFFAYVVTFLISGAFWFLHHVTFHFIRHTDRVLCWINIVFLMFVSLLPFSVGLLSHLRVHPISQFVYFGNQFAIGLLLSVHWWYAKRQHMIAPDAPANELRRINWSVARVTLAFAAAIAGASVEPAYSSYCAVGMLVATWIAQKLRA